jgi:hypothetical protein
MRRMELPFFSLPKELQKEIWKFVSINSRSYLINLLLVSKKMQRHTLQRADISPIQIPLLQHIATEGT